MSGYESLATRLQLIANTITLRPYVWNYLPKWEFNHPRKQDGFRGQKFTFGSSPLRDQNVKDRWCSRPEFARPRGGDWLRFS